MESDHILASGTRTFAPRARLVSVLGEQLIRDARVGLLELVKNAYDADASLTKVELYHLTVPEKTEIVITDNGEGMNRQVMLGVWLEPATGHRQDAKRAGIRSNTFLRLPQIGRAHV